MKYKKRLPVFGLLDIGQYKIYRRGEIHFVSYKDAVGLRRLQLDSKRQAEDVLTMPLRNVGDAIERLLLAAKLRGSPKYYEVKHG